MKIERDKVYVTRSGGKVRVIAVDRPSQTFPIVGVGEDGAILTYRTDGVYEPFGGEVPLDLVSEYVEPPKPREVWVDVTDNGMAGAAWFEHEKRELSAQARARLVKFREVIEA